MVIMNLLNTIFTMEIKYIKRIIWVIVFIIIITPIFFIYSCFLWNKTFIYKSENGVTFTLYKEKYFMPYEYNGIFPPSENYIYIGDPCDLCGEIHVAFVSDSTFAICFNSEDVPLNFKVNFSDKYKYSSYKLENTFIHKTGYFDYIYLYGWNSKKNSSILEIRFYAERNGYVPIIHEKIDSNTVVRKCFTFDLCRNCDVILYQDTFDIETMKNKEISYLKARQKEYNFIIDNPEIKNRSVSLSVNDSIDSSWFN